MDGEHTQEIELLLATLTESMRAQREILELLRQLKREVAALREATAAASDVPVKVDTADEGSGAESDETGMDIPVLHTIVNIDGSPMRAEKHERSREHLTVVD